MELNVTTKKKSEPSAFFLSFIGEHVQVITSFQLATADSPEMPMPLIIEGYMLDADDQYIYMGEEGDQIRQAVKLEYVVYVHILEKENAIEEVFSSLPKVKKRDMN
jgi:hypothetical protein